MLAFFLFDLLGASMIPNDSAKNLVVIFNSDFTFSDLMSAICRTCFQKIRLLSKLKCCLSLKAAIMLANALVSSKLDYCNSLLSSITNKELHRLQLAQNDLCTIVCKLQWRSRVSYQMKSLCWLPLKFRIYFKTYVIIFKTILNDIEVTPI